MPVLRDAGRAEVAARLGAVLLAGIALAGCLGSGGGDPPNGGPSARVAAVRLANCADWKRAGPAVRSQTVADIKRFAGGRTGSPGGYGRTIPDDRAHKLFDNYCDQDFARGFKLYKLYTRAAAFRDR